MKEHLLMASLLVTLFFSFGQAQKSAGKRSDPYPNEVPSLQLYKGAKWKSIAPFGSTKADVEKIMGKPVPIMIDGFGWIPGYDSDPDWKIVVFYIDEGGGCAKSLEGRVSSICLWPKKRISFKGIVLRPQFAQSGLRDERGVDFTVHRDSFGLSYSLYDHDSPDGSFKAGDLSQVSYTVSNEQRGRCL